MSVPDRPPDGAPAHAAVEDVVRSSYGRLLAYLASGTGDITAAEDALADALLAALRTWPERGVPARPDSWLVTVARRNLVDLSRRRATAARALPQLGVLLDERSDPGPGAASGIPDVRLQLMFACTHPAIAEGVRSPLMLQTVLGLDAARIAPLFLVPTATIAQRLVRAKTKIRTAGIPFAVPADDVLPQRLGSVLDAVYAAYTAGWDDPAAAPGTGPDLVQEAVRLARLLVELVPGHAEGHGLLALLLHGEARRRARRAPDGSFVPLDQQDTQLWSRELMAGAEHHLAEALALGDVGPYQLMAAVQSVHNRRAVTGLTDHAAVAALHEGLVHVSPTTGVRVAHAAAVSAAGDPSRALALLHGLTAARVSGYQPYWVARSSVLDRLGRRVEAAEARATALTLTTDEAVRAHLTGLAPSPGPGYRRPMTDNVDVVVTDAPDRSRYEAHVGGELAGWSEYHLTPEMLVFTHTEVQPAFEGRGVGGALARYALDDVRCRGLRALAVCPFVLGWIRRHPAYADLEYRSRTRSGVD